MHRTPEPPPGTPPTEPPALEGTLPVAPPSHLLQPLPAAAPTLERTLAVSPPGGVPWSVAANDGRPRIGRFVVARELGRGGMGLVVAAFDPHLSRHVAIKLIDPRLANPAMLARFAREASAAGRLRHPGIVSVLEAGEDQGRPYLVMDLVEGETLEALLRREPRLPTRQAVELALGVARALGHAHEQGVLHRDVKPANVLLDAHGQPRLADFGVARAGAADLTRTGDMLGTPEYMAPEQAGASAGAHGPASDVYALGATLYRMLVGRPPLQAQNLAGLLKKLLVERPTPPRALDPSIDPALDELVLRCLEKEPAARFRDGGQLAAALERWLVAPAQPARRGSGALRAGVALLGLAAAGGIAAGAFVLGRDAGRSPPEERTSGAAASPPAGEATPAPPAPVVPAAAPVPAPARALAPQGRLRLRRVLGEYGTNHVDQVFAVAASPDGSRLLSGGGWWDLGQRRPGHLQLRDASTGRELAAWRAHGNTVIRVAFTADGARALSSGHDEALRLWELATPPRLLAEVVGLRPYALQRLPGRPERFAVTRVGPRGRSGEEAALVEVEVGDGELRVGRWAPLPGDAVGVTLLPDGLLFVTHNGTGHGPAIVEPERWAVQEYLERPFIGTSALATSPDGRYVLALDHTNLLRQWDARTRQLLFERSLGGEQAPRGASWTPDGARAVLAALGGGVSLWDPAVGAAEAPLFTTPGSGWAVACLPQGRVAVGSDYALRILDIKGGEDAVPVAPLRALDGLAVSPDGNVLAVGGRSPRREEGALVQLYDLRTGEAAGPPLQTGLEAARGLAFDGARGRLVVAGSNGTAGPMRNMQVWDLQDRKAIGRFAATYQYRLNAFAASRDARLVVTGGEDGRVDVWDLTDDLAPAKPALSLPGLGWVKAIERLPDGRVIVAAVGAEGEPHALRIWDLDDLARFVQVDLPRLASAVAGFPGTETEDLLVGFEEGEVERWSLSRRAAVASYPGHSRRVGGVAVTPSGVVVSVADDGLVHATTRSGDPVGSLDLGPSGDLPAMVRVAPGGDTLLIGTHRCVVLEVEVLRPTR
ncbi:MAG: serine/threonine-protein kinase [Planctomycetes bacterium]|nr:serine/threonine-protein kinase [Planctomycetota bacterium]